MDAEKVAESQELVQTEVQSWRLSYEHVIAFQEPRSDGMSYMVVLSKPTKKKPIPDPIVRVHFMVHTGEEKLADGRPPMSFVVENQRLRHWVGDGTFPSDNMFDAIARQKLRSRATTKALVESTPQMLTGLDSATKIHRQTMDDLRRSTKFNEVEMADLIQVFEEVAIPDPVGTGKVIEKAGLIEGLTLLEKHGLAQMDWAASGLVDSFFHVFDKNASGSIDMKEFCIGVAMLTKGSLKDKIRLAFDIIDVNKSGSLDRDEMGSFLKCLIQSGPAACGSSLVSDDQLGQIVSQAFTVIDANNDQKIEFEEFAQWAANANAGNMIAAAFC